MSPWVAAWSSGLGAALALTTLVWVGSLVKRDVSIIDGFWGPGFALLAFVYSLSGDGWSPRKWVLLGLVSLWGLRLSVHIFRRSRGKGEDYRYREMRRKQGARFAWLSLVTVFWLQAALMWLISAPLLQVAHASSPLRWTWLDPVAFGLFALGFTFEAVGDYQLTRFRADESNRGKVLRTGLWRYTRHPNYFGDAVVWWSFFVFALATPGALWTIYSPLLMTFLLLRVSGVGLLEKKLKRTRPEYADYVARTNAFVPWFPRSAASPDAAEGKR